MKNRLNENKNILSNNPYADPKCRKMSVSKFVEVTTFMIEQLFLPELQLHI